MIDKNNLPKHWEIKKLGEIAKFIDYRGKTPQKTNLGIPLITAKNVKMGFIKEEPREFIAEKDYHSWMTRGKPNYDDVLFTTEAPLGNVAQLKTNNRIALAQRIITFQTLDFVNSTFLKFSLMNPQFQVLLNTKGTGTTVKGIKAAILKQLEIPLPPLPEQQKIVTKIEELFSDLDKGKQQLEIVQKQLKIYRQALLKWAFEGRFTNKNVKKGELPEGWKWVKIGEETINYDGKRVPLNRENRSKRKGTYRYYGATEIVDYIDDYIFDGIYLLIGEDGANLLSKSRPLAFIVEGKFWVNNHAHVLQTKKSMNLKFLCNYFNSIIIAQFVTGSAQPKLTQANLNNILVPLPPLEEQLHIAQEIESRLSVCDKLEATITHCLQQAEILRQSILKKAFEGKIV